MQLGYTYLEAGRPRDAAKAFDEAEASLPAGASNAALAAADHGRALAWSTFGDLRKATYFEEKAVALAPLTPDYWNQLARLYDQQGRAADALKASERAQALTAIQQP
jgi:tetratricopeptide (TPR) repeat protein